MNNQKKHSLLNGRYTLITEEREMRMSHLVNGFAIIDTATKKYLTNALGLMWHLMSFEEKGDTITLQCKKYPYGIPGTITINFPKGLLYVNRVRYKMEQYRDVLQ